ncbi:MAG: hypothetical protein GXY83_40145 [Rhodopirellula sp.]|nr:hypothetical protein [Rhodopirellula sp.]
MTDQMLAEGRLWLYQRLFDWFGPPLGSLYPDRSLPPRSELAELVEQGDEEYRRLYCMAPPKTPQQWRELAEAAGVRSDYEKAGLEAVMNELVEHLVSKGENPWTGLIEELTGLLESLTTVLDEFPPVDPSIRLEQVDAIINDAQQLIERFPADPVVREVHETLMAVGLMARDFRVKASLAQIMVLDKEEAEEGNVDCGGADASELFARARSKYGDRILELTAKLRVARQSGLPGVTTGFQTLADGKFRLYREIFDWFGPEVAVHHPPEDDQDCEAIQVAEQRADEEFGGMFNLAPPRSWQQWRDLAAAANCADLACEVTGLERIIKHFVTIVEEQEADSETNCEKEPPVKLPKNPDVLRLAVLIRERDEGQTNRDVALDFTDGDEKRAANLLRQLRRFPNLTSMGRTRTRTARKQSSLSNTKNMAVFQLTKKTDQREPRAKRR